jgi:uncharacterized UBP type Zn finger protein
VSGFGERVRGLVSRLTDDGSGCSHLDQAHMVEPLSEGCQECLRQDMEWVHLRLCLACGYVGCCNASEGRHAYAHFEETGHPIMRSHEPGEIWSWCWIDEVEL